MTLVLLCYQNQKEYKTTQKTHTSTPHRKDANIPYENR